MRELTYAERSVLEAIYVNAKQKGRYHKGNPYATKSQIKQIVGFDLKHISKYLKNLRERGLVSKARHEADTFFLIDVLTETGVEFCKKEFEISTDLSFH